MGKCMQTDFFSWECFVEPTCFDWGFYSIVVIFIVAVVLVICFKLR